MPLLAEFRKQAMAVSHFGLYFLLAAALMVLPLGLRRFVLAAHGTVVADFFLVPAAKRSFMLGAAFDPRLPR